jgi:hypothetical protein
MEKLIVVHLFATFHIQFTDSKITSTINKPRFKISLLSLLCSLFFSNKAERYYMPMESAKILNYLFNKYLSTE